MFALSPAVVCSGVCLCGTLRGTQVLVFVVGGGGGGAEGRDGGTPFTHSL